LGNFWLLHQHPTEITKRPTPAPDLALTLWEFLAARQRSLKPCLTSLSLRSGTGRVRDGCAINTQRGRHMLVAVVQELVQLFSAAAFSGLTVIQPQRLAALSAPLSIAWHWRMDETASGLHTCSEHRSSHACGRVCGAR
jgi:hypothetical protein